MPNGMDYSLLQRVIDGTGMILDTEPGTPNDVGTYVTESQLADWIKGKILFTGYYYNGNFYSDSGHTTLLAKVNGALYIDQTNANKALYVCLSSTYQSLTEEAQVQAIIDGLNDGTIVPLKAKQDQNGNVIDTTYATKAELAAEESSREAADSNLKSAIQKNTAEIENLKQTSAQTEITVSYPDDGNYSALMPNLVPAKSAKYAEIKGLRAKSRAWNQMASEQSSDWSLSNVSLTASGNVITVTPTTNSAVTKYALVPVIESHVYLVAGSIAKNANGGATATIGFFGSAHSVSHVTASNDSATAVSFTELYKAGSGDAYFEIRPSSSMPTSESVNCNKLILRDLTVIFPELSSSDITTLGVAGLVKLCPDLLTYDAFGKRIVNETESGVDSVGVNIWDEETALYGGGGNILGSKNNIPVLMGQTYHITPSIPATGTDRYYIQFLDSDGNQISDKSIYGNASDFTFTTPIGCWYLMFYIFGSYGTVYKDDIQISEVHGSVTTINTTYHPYMTDTLSLTTPFTGKSAGSVYDTDELNVEVLVDGQKVNRRRQTQNVNYVDCSELEFGYNSTYEWWSASYTSGVPLSPYVKNCLYKIGISSNANELIANHAKLGYFINDNNMSSGQKIYIRNGSSTTPPDGLFYYEAPTPTVTILDPIINNTLKVEPNGTIETVQTQSPVLDNSMSVNFDLIP